MQKETITAHFYGGRKIALSIILFGCIARWDPQKDHKNLIRAIEILEEKSFKVPFLLLLIGPNMTYDNSELCDLISHRKENILLLLNFIALTNQPDLTGQIS